MTETTQTQTPNVQNGQIVHTELITNNVEETKAFMSKTFGWAYDEQPMPGTEGETYSMWKVGDQVFGGVTPPGPSNMPPGTLNYLLVDDVDTACTTIEANGGTILQPGMDVGGHGRMAVFREPGGAVLAVWQTFQG